MTPDDANAAPLTDVFDGYITQKDYDLSTGIRLIGNGKTGFLGTSAGGVSHSYNYIEEFRGKPWVAAPNN
jgi:hypothetical protein